MQQKMNAIETKEYGSPAVFQLNKIEKPAPKANEVLVRNYATTVTAADIMMRKGKPYIGRLYLGLRKPKRTVIGFEFAGEVVEVGADVTKFKVGEKVFGGTTKLGGYAEFICVSESEVLTTIPGNISYAEAAPVNGSAITVMNFLKRLGNIKQGQKVLINGAAGGLGSYAVQIAKHFGAEVTGVSSMDNLELVEALGADHIIDYTEEDFTKNGKKYDLIFDTVGKRTFAQCKNSLTERGIYLSPVAGLKLLLQMIWTSFGSGKKAKTSSTGLLPVAIRLGYFLELRELLKNNQIKTLVDRQYSIGEMAKAHEYVETGRKRGAVVINL